MSSQGWPAQCKSANQHILGIRFLLALRQDWVNSRYFALPIDAALSSGQEKWG